MTTHERLAALTGREGSWLSLRRIVSAWCMPAAIALLMLSNSVFAYLNPDGLTEEVGAEAVELFERGPDLWTVSILSGLVGVLLLVPGTLAVMRAVRLDKPRLSLIAGVLMLGGYICYFGIMFSSFDLFAWILFDPQRTIEFIDQSQVSGASIPFFLFFVAGNLLGTLLLGLAIVLGHTIPRWAGFLVMGWPVGHIINLTVGNEWFAVAGGALELAGMIVVALGIMRFSDREWLERG